MPDFQHHLVGRAVVYRDPYKDAPEQGIVTSVNVEANLVFVRYGLGSTSAATAVDERLTFLNGEPVCLAAP
jgi:hypothetical protein